MDTVAEREREQVGQAKAHTISITHMDRHVATPAAVATAPDAALWLGVGWAAAGAPATAAASPELPKCCHN